MQKNVAGQKWIVFAFDRTDNTPKTGDAGNITANLRIDGAAANPVDDVNPAELEGGYYVFDITQAESNGNLLALCPSSVTADIQVIGVPGAVWTRPASFKTVVHGAAAAGTLSTTQMTTDLTEATNDHYNGRVIIWTSGDLTDQATDITDYDGATKMLTYTAITEAPGAGDTFTIV
jgi:D-alanyl-D-alanine carboxypeptidase